MEMRWISQRRRLLRDPQRLWSPVRSILTVGLAYPAAATQYDHLLKDPSRGAISRYAWGRDYHKIVGKRLLKLGKSLSSLLGRPVDFRKFVDAGPLLERPLAAQAVGFIGKNTLLIHPPFGSGFFLGELLLDLDLEPDAPEQQTGCGSCVACMKHCPTGALELPYRQTTRRCLSYHTIEGGEVLPHAIRPLMGNRVFGCDECQTSCPFNHDLDPERSDPAFLPRDETHVAPKLTEAVQWDEATYNEIFAGSVVRRNSRDEFVRNCAVALGNWGTEDTLVILEGVLRDSSAVVRAHAAWAAGRCKPKHHAATLLKDHLAKEQDALVLLEGRRALSSLG